MVLGGDSHPTGKSNFVASDGAGAPRRAIHYSSSHGRQCPPRHAGQRSAGGRQTIERVLLHVVDGSMAGAIFVVPLLMGGRHAAGQLALTVLAVAAAWAWAVRQTFCIGGKRGQSPFAENGDSPLFPPGVPLALAGLVLLVLQTVPLPPWLLAVASPRAADLLPLWNTEANDAALFGRWSCVSFAPAETLAALVIFLDYAMLFFVGVRRIERIEDVERILRWCALSAVAMAALGIAQLLTANGKFLWFYEYPFSDTHGVAKGAFSNRNHFAQFLALGIGPLIWWLQDAMRRTRGDCPNFRVGENGTVPFNASKRGQMHRPELSVYLAALSLGIVLFAGLLSLSRGGAAAMFVAAAICTVVCYRTTSLGKRFVAALAAAGVLIGVSLAIFGYDRVSNRLDDFTAGSLDLLDQSAGRRNIWATTLAAIPHHAAIGAGVGSYRAVYPAYVDAPMQEDIEPSHAENGYLQIALETGLVGLFLVAAGIVLFASWCAGGIQASASTRSRLCAAAIAASLAASAVHSLVDFVWYVPACMAIVSILAACAFRVWQMDGNGGARGEERNNAYSSRSRNEKSSFIAYPAFSGAIAVMALTLAGGWMIADRVGPAVAQVHWDQYLVARRAAETPDLNREIDPLADVETQERWLADLENVVRWQPTHAQAHLKLVETHRRLFELRQAASENPMSLLQISDAVFNEPQFRSREALMEWLPRATGPHWVHLEQCIAHARRALALCPLEGRAYVHLAELSFLWSQDRAAAEALIAQAMRVRPFDGNVLYAAGNMALLKGDETHWRECLRRAVGCGPKLRRQIIQDRVAATLPENIPAVVEDILREFEPDMADARFLHDLCKERCNPERLEPLTRYRIERAAIEAPVLPRPEAANAWLEAARLRRQLGENEDSLKAARCALELNPENYAVRSQLGLCLLDAKLYAEAEPHLRWCLQRAPNNQGAQKKLRDALRGRLDVERRAAKQGVGGRG